MCLWPGANCWKPLGQSNERCAGKCTSANAVLLFVGFHGAAIVAVCFVYDIGSPLDKIMNGLQVRANEQLLTCCLLGLLVLLLLLLVLFMTLGSLGQSHEPCTGEDP